MTDAEFTDRQAERQADPYTDTDGETARQAGKRTDRQRNIN